MSESTRHRLRRPRVGRAVVVAAVVGATLGLPLTALATPAGASAATHARVHAFDGEGTAPTITSPASTTFSEGVAGSFTVTTTGTPTATTSETGDLPSGLTFVDNGDGTATLAGTPAVGSNGTYTLDLDATNGVAPDATQELTVTVTSGAAITSPASADFTAGVAGSFTVTSTGNPTAALTETGSLPGGLTFTDNGDGTATIAGTATATGTTTVDVSADNGVGAPATQEVTLVVGSSPAISSAAATTFTAGSAGAFTVTTTGYPAPALSESGALPAGVTLTDNGDGTATLAGTAAATAGGVYHVTVDATGTFGAASQSFTLTVDAAPAITSPTTVSLPVGTVDTFQPTTLGFPAPSVTVSGILPPGMSLVGDTLSGTPTLTGAYPLNYTAGNGVGHAVDTTITVDVTQAPAFTSAPTTVFNEGQTNGFAVSAAGFPAPTFTESGALPAGVTFSGGRLSGTPTQTGSFPLTLTASNGVGTAATQSFTLTVYALHVTTTSLPTLTEGTAYSVQYTAGGASGTVLYKWVKLASLPKGLKLSKDGVLSGTVSTHVPPGVYTVSVGIESTTKGVTQTAASSLRLTIVS